MTNVMSHSYNFLIDRILSTLKDYSNVILVTTQ